MATVAIIMPRGMHFSPRAASSIDLCVRDAVLNSEFHSRTHIVCEEIADYFPGFSVRPFRKSSKFIRLNEIRKILREIRPDLIVAQQHLPTASALAKAFPETKVLLHKHNFIKESSGFRQQRRYRQLNRLAGILHVSDACQKQFSAAYPECRTKSYVVPNGLDEKEWHPGQKDHDQVIAVGQISDRKGMADIAEALARVLPKYPGWSAKVIGAMSEDQGTKERFLAALTMTDRVEWVGYLPHAEVVAEVCRSKIAIVNSREEAFGRVALEAFAGGAALISSEVGGLKEVVSGACMPLVEGSSAEIADKLEDLIKDPSQVEELASLGRARFLDQYTIEQSARALDCAFVDVLGNAPSALSNQDP
ncbi:MAG: glycosyltransferase family 4 protein [Pseudomonadota bacterium]